MFYKTNKNLYNRNNAAGNIILAASGFIFFAVCLAFLIPFILSFVPLFSKRFDFTVVTGSGYKNVNAAYRIFKIAIFTITQAFLSALLATVVGLCAAFFCANRKFKLRRFLLSLSSVPLCVPSIIIALAFIIFFGNNGILNSMLKTILKKDESIVNFLFSITGVILIHAFYNFPIAMRTISRVWEKLGTDEENAALLLGASKFRIFKTITLPALLNPVAASFLLIFLFCFFSFIIILLFGGTGLTTLEVELYKTARASLNINFASKIAVIEFCIASSVIFLYSAVQKKLAGKLDNTKPLREKSSIKEFKEKLFFTIIIGIIFSFLIFPLISIFLHSTYNVNYNSFLNKFFYFKAWKNICYSKMFWTSFAATIKLGICTAVITLSASIFFVYLTLYKPLKRIAAILPYFPLAVSSVMLGFGWFILKPSSSITVLIFAQSSLALPFAWTQIQNCILSIPKNILNAGIILSYNKTDLFFRIILPLCKKGFISAFAFVFAISAGDASLPIVLNIPHFQNLALLLFDYAGSYRFTESSAVATVLAITTGFVFFLQDRDNIRYEQ